MKRLLSVLLTFVLLLGMTGCGTVDDEIIPPVSGSQNNTGSSVPQTTTPPASDKVTIQETVLLDEAGVKITAKSLELDGFLGVEVKLLVENNTNKNLIVQAQNVSVNSYMIEPIMSIDIAAGKKANDTLVLTRDSLDDCGIETIADIEFSFNILQSDDWSTYYESAPVQLLTSAAATYTYTYDDTGTLVYDENSVKIVVKGLAKNDSLFGPGLVVYIHNSKDSSVTVQTQNCSVNGFMVTPIFSEDVGAKKHSISSITFMSSELTENKITQIKEVELSFHIFDSENWSAIADTAPIKLNFQ